MSSVILPMGAPAPAPRPGVLAFETRDFDHMASSFRGWDCRMEQLGRGRFHGRLRLTPPGPAQLLDAEVNLAVHAQGEHVPGSYGFSPVEPASAGARWRGRYLRPGMVNVIAPGEEMNHASTDDYRSTTLHVHGGLLRRVCSAVLGVDPERLLVGGTPHLGAERGAGVLARWRGFLDAPGGAPGASADPTDLVVDFVRALAAGRLVDPVRTTPAQRLRVVRQAQEYARSVPPEAVSILTLCEHTDVSARTLHYAFEEVLGVTPKAYLKTLRLNAAWRDLAGSAPARGRVEAIARRHGFTHLGGFAQDFRRQFGALPSAILGARVG
jgi:AraC-like DNA-binding protein